MISRIAAVVLALASFLWNEASAAAETISPADFHSKVVSLYNFEPRALGTADVPVKSAQLDEFWSFVKVNAPQALPLLRAELSDPSNSSFFFYDGAKLLLSLSKDKSDQSIVLRSLPKADLRSVDHTDYLITVHWFARNGFDTRQAALRILDFPDFEAFIPLHALRLGQNYSLIYMLFPTKESVFVGDLQKGSRARRPFRPRRVCCWRFGTP